MEKCILCEQLGLNPSSFCRFLRSGPGPFHCSSQADYFIWRGLCHFHRCMARCPWAWETLWHHPQRLEHPMLGLWPPLLGGRREWKDLLGTGSHLPIHLKKRPKGGLLVGPACWILVSGVLWRRLQCLAWRYCSSFAHFHLLPSDRYFLQLSCRSGDIFRGG